MLKVSVFLCIFSIFSVDGTLAPIRERVANLLSQMTIEELIGETVTPDSSNYDLYAATYANTSFGQISMHSFDIEKRNNLQRKLLSTSRLRIPVLFSHESLHGGCYGATVFPESLTMGATWDGPLIQRVYRVIAKHTRMCGASVAFAPVINLFRDPRFGRHQEGFSADPALTAALAKAAITGLQGPPAVTDGAASYLANDSVVALAKHFFAYGSAAGGLNAAAAEVSAPHLWAIYLRPWRAAVAAGLRALMVSHQIVDGIPMHANGRWINGVMRGVLGFDGYAISDCNDLFTLIQYRVAADPVRAAALGLNAGVDGDLQCAKDTYTIPNVLAALKDRSVSEASLRAAATRVLTAKFAAGLFDAPYAPVVPKSAMNSPDAQALALSVAEGGIVLAINENNTLPLNRPPLTTSSQSSTAASQAPKPLTRIAVLGQLGVVSDKARAAMLGSYTSDDGTVAVPSILDALKASLHGDASVNVVSEVGASPDEPADSGSIRKAVDAARGADVAILVVGDSLKTCGEWGDRSSLDLKGGQLELLIALAAAKQSTPGQRLIVVLLNGAPTTFGADQKNQVLLNVDGLLICGRPGQAGATAVANILFGSVNPSARLQANWLRSSQQVGSGGAHFVEEIQGKWIRHTTVRDPTGRAYDSYKDPSDSPLPLFPFGHGLSYTSFVFKSIRGEVVHMAPSDRTEVDPVIVLMTVEVTNSGTRDGAVVVQVYVVDPPAAGPGVRPWRRLVGFTKVLIKAGGSVAVHVPVHRDDMAWADVQLSGNVTWTVAPGNYTFYVGDSSYCDGLSTIVTI